MKMCCIMKPIGKSCPPGEKPIPKTFFVARAGLGQRLYHEQDELFAGMDIFVGIDLVSGFYCVEGSSYLWDELCAFQGLDERDRENFFCVAQYITCLKRFDLLEAALG